MMRRILSLCVTIAILSPAISAEVKRYDGALWLYPSRGEMRADITVTVADLDHPVTQQTFYLNEALKLTSFDCRMCSSHVFDPARTGEFRYAPHAVPLTIQFKKPLKTGEVAKIRLHYQGKIIPDKWGTNMISENWTELALYSGWFPLDPNAKEFNYDLRVNVDKPYGVSGDGALSGANGKFRLQQGATNDIVVATSRGLRTEVVNQRSLRIRIDSAGLTPGTTEKIAAVASDISGQYASWFGAKGSGRLTILLNPRTGGGGYARPGFISYPMTDADAAPDRFPKIEKTLAHEIAHLWWAGAPVTTWEDWLNESLAEYSAWMYVREARGQAAFDSLLEKARKDSSGKPAIWGLDRNHSDAYTVLYEKGPVCLYELEQRLGQSRFRDFLAALQKERVHSTDDFLALLERTNSREARKTFEDMLKN